jgi:hypothetical protein
MNHFSGMSQEIDAFEEKEDDIDEEKLSDEADDVFGLSKLAGISSYFFGSNPKFDEEGELIEYY